MKQNKCDSQRKATGLPYKLQEIICCLILLKKMININGILIYLNLLKLDTFPNEIYKTLYIKGEQ